MVLIPIFESRDETKKDGESIQAPLSGNPVRFGFVLECR